MSVSNKVILIGRLTKDIEVRNTESGKSVASFSIAVNRPYNKEHDHPEADFFNCVAWEQRAEFIAKWFAKGDEIRIAGRLQTRKWEKDGEKRSVTEIVVEEVEFGQKKRDGQNLERPMQASTKPTQKSTVDDESDDLPF